MRIVPATTYRNDLCTPVVTLPLRGDPRAPGEVRVVLRDVFHHRKIDEESAADGLVMATELVTNALQYAPGPYGFGVCAFTGSLPGTDPAPWLVCGVADGGPLVPLFDDALSTTEFASPASGGRGLVLVRKLSRGRCGIRRWGTGKAVWFALEHP